MKYITLICFVLFSTIAMAGDWEKRSLSYFDEIKISGNLRVELVQSDTTKLEIYDICCSMSEIKIDQSGKLLKVNNDKGLINDNEFDIILYYNKLNDITVQRGASLDSRDKIIDSSLNIVVHSGANVNLTLDLNFLDIMATTGSHIELEGELESLKTNVNTGATLDMEKTRAGKAEVKSLTGGMSTYWITEEIKAVAGTGGSIEYYGNPKKTDTDTHLGGSIQCHKD